LSSNRPPIRILVVDDSEEFVAAAKEWIDSNPLLAFVGSAESGLEALDLVDRLEPDVVLIDVVMPGIDGLETARRLRERGRPLRLVMTSFSDSESVRRAALAAGGDTFLAKADLADRLVEELEASEGGSE